MCVFLTTLWRFYNGSPRQYWWGEFTFYTDVCRFGYVYLYMHGDGEKEMTETTHYLVCHQNVIRLAYAVMLKNSTRSSSVLLFANNLDLCCFIFRCLSLACFFLSCLLVVFCLMCHCSWKEKVIMSETEGKKEKFKRLSAFQLLFSYWLLLFLEYLHIIILRCNCTKNTHTHTHMHSRIHTHTH